MTEGSVLEALPPVVMCLLTTTRFVSKLLLGVVYVVRKQEVLGRPYDAYCHSMVQSIL